MKAPKSSSPRSALLEARAQTMRRHPTPSEAALWQLLKAQRLGVAFRRQAVIEDFIVEFLPPKPHLVVEVDGPYHARRQSADARRDRTLRKMGFHVLRLESSLVMRQPRTATQLVLSAVFSPYSSGSLAATSSHSSSR